MKIECKQTVYLRRKADGELENLLRIYIDKPRNEVITVYVNDEEIFKDRIKGTIEYWIDEPKEEYTICIKACGENLCEEKLFLLKVPVHREIHMVHMSHHDPGYTDLMSNVFKRHSEWFDAILDEMEMRDNYPDEVRLRIAVEQFWSLDYYLSHTSKENRERIIKRIKKGDIELTALYGNLITEQLGHEECYRAMYPANELAEKCGIKISTAVHNDIPGVSWGLCRALCDAGIEFLAADFPKYYDWGFEGLVSFWDSVSAYGYEGPGACYWKAQDGKRLLLWNSDAILPDRWDEDEIEGIAERLYNSNYPFNVFRVTVKAGNIDNSRFIPDYADNAYEWNKKYAYPHIVISTNERFKNALEFEVEKRKINIPEIRGEMPGQDYPLGAMSMAVVTASARKTQNKIVAAEKLSTLIIDDDKFNMNRDIVNSIWRDLLLSDDHAYGYQFPAGPAMKASYWEKGTYAARAEANTHDVFDKALASLADRIDAQGTELRLIVFNPSQKTGNRAVKVSMREFDNCGTILCKSNDDSQKLKGYLLNNRRRVNPDKTIWDEGLFELVDMQTKKKIPYFIEDLNWSDPEYYAPESYGLGMGTRRYGFFELPGGLKRKLCFVAEDLPAFGYRCYALIRKPETSAISKPHKADYIENGIYRIKADSNGICSIIDLRKDKELLDVESKYRIGDILVRNGRDDKADVMKTERIEVTQNDIYGEIKQYARIRGAYELCVRFSIWKDIDEIDVEVHMLKSAEPLQTMFISFPFSGDGFRYQGMLSELEPARDIVPGAQSDFLTVRDYVKVKGSNILWSSNDTAVVSLGNLWKGYISPAHSCIMQNERHIPLKEEDFCGNGHIFAMLCANNFGTNFMCSQSFDGVYKFSFSSMVDNVDDVYCARWGECQQNPAVTQFTDRSRGDLPPVCSLLNTENLHCLALKRAEDGDGYVARLWNHSDREVPLKININNSDVCDLKICNNALECETTNACSIMPKSVVTVRFNLQCTGGQQ